MQIKLQLRGEAVRFAHAAAGAGRITIDRDCAAIRVRAVVGTGSRVPDAAVSSRRCGVQVEEVAVAWGHRAIGSC